MIHPGTSRYPTPKFTLPDNPSDRPVMITGMMMTVTLLNKKLSRLQNIIPRSADSNQTKTSAGLSGRLTVSTAELQDMILSDCKPVYYHITVTLQL